MAYAYRAKVWCDDCGRAIRARLIREGKAPASPDDERTWDRDEHPKRVRDDAQSDVPQHCAAGKDCINAVTLPGGAKVGYLFGELTEEGVEYVKEAIVQAPAANGLGSREVVELWRRYYTEKGYALPPFPTDLEALLGELLASVDRAGDPQSRQGRTANHDVLVPIPAELLRRLRAACSGAMPR